MAKAIVEDYANRKWKFVVWPQIGDIKGPKEANWPDKAYSLDDYKEGNRVGLLLGQEVAPGEYLHDVDIDWDPGLNIAVALLPPTEFIFGRASKRISHLFYITEEPIPTIKYADSDGTTLLEIRGVKSDGDLGFQTMVPPSIWTKGDRKEPLAFVKSVARPEPGKTSVRDLKDIATTIAIGMLFAKRCAGGRFTHEVRLAWAGLCANMEIPKERMITLGKEIVKATGNKDEHDIDLVVTSTLLRKEKGEKINSTGVIRDTVGKDVVGLINKWLEKTSPSVWITDKNGLPVKDKQDNIRIGLQKLGIDIEYDSFSAKKYLLEKGFPKRELTGDLHNNVYLRFDKAFKFLPSFALYEKVVNDIAYTNPKHPVLEYLDALEWDKKPRLDSWLIDYGGADDNEYVRAVSAILLIAAVRRVREHEFGVKYDEIVILEGQQGTGKSTALRNLCPRDDWFSDGISLDLIGKELMENTAGKWIIEVAELSGRNRAEVNQIKAMLSRKSDTARMSYQEKPETRHRQFIFVGTVNDSQYISDSTGARRFWPVKTRRFDFDGIAEARDQLWAEANFREKAREAIQLRQELWEVAEQHQEARFETDPWEDTIRDTIESIHDVRQEGIYITRDALMEALGIDVARRNRAESKRISDIMLRLKFFNTTMRTESGAVARGYVRKGYTKGDKLWED